LSWIEDESNINENFYRNFVRHKVMPLLQEKWPSIATTISRSAQHHAHGAAVVDEYMALLSGSVIDAQGQLHISSWLALSEVSQMAMLRFWLKPRVNKMPSAAVLMQIVELSSAQQDAQPECCWGEDMVSRYAGKLYARKLDTSKALAPFDIQLDDNAVYTHALLPYGIELISGQSISAQSHCFMMTDKTLRVEFGGFSRVCKLDPKRPSKSIKKWLQSWQVPPWERAKIPILMHGEQVLAVGSHLALLELPAPELSKDTRLYIRLHSDKKMPA
jgi:tRNA(Ile)-lysidine synthase